MTGLTILYIDRFLLAVDKPSGLLSVPGRGPGKADCAAARAADKYGWIREVHRLDQATSGILLLARTPEAHRFLSGAFEAREIEKTYIALTETIPKDPGRDGVVCRFNESCNAGRITLYQRLDPDKRPLQIVDSHQGRKAVTDWRLLAREGGFKRLELRPVTGRTHQLRLALRVCGAPIPGDSLYSPAKIRDSAPRLMLHAGFLCFPHPDGSGKMELDSPVPF